MKRVQLGVYLRVNRNKTDKDREREKDKVIKEIVRKCNREKER